MDIRTTVSNTAHQAQFDRMDDYGMNLVEVSSHAGARPKCAKDQGKIFNRNGGGGYTEDLHGKKIRYYAWKDSSYGEPDGLLGINCGHQVYPFTPGIDVQRYFPYDEKENADLYEKTQVQRELERRVRRSKRECMVLDELGDEEGLRKASVTLKQRQQTLQQYCADNGLSYKPDRTAVVGYNRTVAGKVNAANRRKTLDKSGGSGIIEESTKKPITQIDDKAIERVPVRSISGYTEEQCTEIQKQHRELLKYSKDKNDHKEVAFVFDRELGDRKEYVGTDDSVDFGNALYGKDLVVLHNHPRNGSFSFRDVVEFIANGSIKTLTIVKNNGGLETLTKRHNYDTLAMLRELNRLEKNNVKTHSEKEYRKIIEKFLNKHHKGGILEWTK